MPLTTDPASPPQTPIKVTQASYRKKPRHRSGKKKRTVRPRPTVVQQSAPASGQQQQQQQQQQQYAKIAKTVPFRPHPFRPDELSPRSSDSSGMMDDCRNDDDLDERGNDSGNDDGDDANDDNDDNDDDDDDDDDDGDENGARLQFESDPYSSSGGSLPQFSYPVDIPRSQASPRLSPLQQPSVHDSGSASSSASDEEAKGAAEAEVSSLASSPLIEATVIIEELFDFDSDGGRIAVMLPDSIEEPESEREASPTAATKSNRRGTLNFSKGRRRLSSFRAVRPPDIDRSVMSGLRGFSFRTVSDEEVVLDDNDEDEDDSDFDEESYNQFRLKQREERRRRRMTSGSIGKRTITESIGSDTDNEDLRSQLDISEVGSSARRLRRRIGDRTSLQFSDPPPPRIDELDEPDTTTDNDEDDEDDIRELEDGESLARELPYYTLEFISMEVDSP